MYLFNISRRNSVSNYCQIFGYSKMLHRRLTSTISQLGIYHRFMWKVGIAITVTAGTGKTMKRSPFRNSIVKQCRHFVLLLQLNL